MGACVLRQTTSAAPGRKWDKHYDLTLHLPGQRQALGAPDLTDELWLYGGEKTTIAETIINSRNGVMPAWAGRLDPETIKELAIYVHSLGGGQ